MLQHSPTGGGSRYLRISVFLMPSWSIRSALGAQPQDLSCDFSGDWGGYPNKNVQCGYHYALLAGTIFVINN